MKGTETEGQNFKGMSVPNSLKKKNKTGLK